MTDASQSLLQVHENRSPQTSLDLQWVLEMYAAFSFSWHPSQEKGNLCTFSSLPDPLIESYAK